MNTQALTAYQQTSVHTQVEGASPHKLITMLLDGALERTQKAKLAIVYRRYFNLISFLGYLLS